MICQNYIDEADLVSCGMCNVGALTAGQAEQIITTASQIIYLLTGQQFPGQCEDTVRPCNCGTCGSAFPYPVRFGTTWQNVCGTCNGYCGSPVAILLPKRPVISISNVTVDGDNFSSYRLDSPGYLVRTDGGIWPSCQNIALDTSQDGTWSISYLYGKIPPEAIRFATTVLSSELVKACAGDGTCRIPAGAVTVQRQGVTYNLDVTDGRTGLYEVDQIIKAFNPHGIKRRARVYSADDIEWSRTSTGS